MKKFVAAMIIFFVLVSLGCEKEAQIWTTSGRGVILPDALDTTVDLRLPECRDGSPLIQGVQVGPEIGIGNTLVDVVQLKYWGVTVPVYQKNDSGARKVALNALADGPTHVTAALPAGQAVSSTTNLPVRIRVLGAFPPNQHPRFEFNVHVWGICGEPFIVTTP